MGTHPSFFFMRPTQLNTPSLQDILNTYFVQNNLISLHDIMYYPKEKVMSSSEKSSKEQVCVPDEGGN